MFKLRAYDVVLDIAGWLLFMALPLLFVNGGQNNVLLLHGNRLYWLFCGTYIFLFYFNAYLLIPKANGGRANSLHYKQGFSIGHFIAQLNNKIPVIKDNRGNEISFEVANFELIESHIEDISLHKVAINYQTGLLLLIEIMGEYLLLADDNLPEHGPVDTFVLRMQPDLSIVSYEEINQPHVILSAS